jgi:hypothetical protein
MNAYELGLQRDLEDAARDRARAEAMPHETVTVAEPLVLYAADVAKLLGLRESDFFELLPTLFVLGFPEPTMKYELNRHPALPTATPYWSRVDNDLKGKPGVAFWLERYRAVTAVVKIK